MQALSDEALHSPAPLPFPSRPQTSSDLSPLATCVLSCTPKTSDSSEASDGSNTAGSSSSGLLLHLLDPADQGPGQALHLLRWLSLQGVANVLDLSPLAACTRLQRLHLRGCPSIYDLSPLARCSQVRTSGWLHRQEVV